jgi:hypothetical protein
MKTRTFLQWIIIVALLMGINKTILAQELTDAQGDK